MSDTTTAFDPSTVTVEDVDEALTRLCEEHPGWTNPRIPDPERETGWNCVYDLDGRHCLIGQYLVDHGLPLPAGNGEAYSVTNRLGFSHAASMQFARWQDYADDAPSGRVLRWGQVPAQVEGEW